MSILLGPYDDAEPSTEPKEAEQLLVFGYACKLFRDDTKALLESSGQLLIPWMGDNSLMVDRYDVRNRLEDKSQFGVKSNLPYKLSTKERELEEQLDMERYLALHWDDIRVEEQEEEERRRALESTVYSAIGFSYDDEAQESPKAPCSPPPPERVEPVPKIEAEDGEEFVAPTGLVIPEGMKVPTTAKLHSIIQKTALFVCQQGTQFEIIIKTKQQANPLFSFLDMQDPLFPYYCHLKAVLANGSYVPTIPEQTESENKPQTEGERGDTEIREDEVQSESKSLDTNGENGKEAANLESEPTSSSTPTVEVDATSTNGSTEQDQSTDEESGSDSEEEGYLHPLLMQAMNPRSKSSTPTPTVPTAKEATPPREEPSLSAVSFRAKSMVVNAAPELQETVEETTVQANNVQQATTENTYGSYPYCGPASQYTEQSSYYQDGYPPPPHMHEGHYHPHTAHYSHPPHNLDPSDQYGYNYNSYYEAMGYPQSHEPYSNTIPIPPPELKSIIDKTASYVAKNGDTFEATVLKKHVDDPKFGFLHPWDKHHSYYQQQKQVYSAQKSVSNEPVAQVKSHLIATERHSVQKLSSAGAVRFKLQSKTTKLIGEPLVERNESELEPQAKRPRVDAGGAKMGFKVQEFLSTVKELFKHGQTPS